MKLLVKGCILGMTILCAVPLTGTYAQSPQSGRVTQESLGNLIKAMGLRPKLDEKRYDFRFKAILHKQEWELSMSSVLSTDGRSIWIMAWLDELPKSAADVPRTALLRLLADNDRLGKGKFFAYIASNRRFVLQRVVPNQDISTASFRDALKDLATSVVVTYPHWSVQNWTNNSGSSATAGAQPGNSARPVSRSSIRDSKYGAFRRK